MSLKTANTAIQHKSKLFYNFEKWFIKNNIKVFYFLLSLCVLLSLISFNARISEAHDDALYLEGGWRFVHEFPTYFYTQNAPLYPLFLAFLIKIVGFKLILFKLFSVVFNAFGFILLYKALKNRIPAIVFVPVAFFQATNHLIIYYSSMTFTEAQYFFLQGLFFWYSVKIIDAIKDASFDLKKQYKLWLMLGLSMFLISTCKSSAIVVVPSIILFFLIEKNYKELAASVLSFLIFKLPYDLMVKIIWGGKNQFSGQSKILLQKDPYDIAQGNEDLSGFVGRFIDNSAQYMGKRFYQIIGWRDENYIPEVSQVEAFGLAALVSIAIILLGFWLIIKQKNKPLILLSIFSISQAVLSFVILQARWDQARIVLIGMPVFLILMLYVIYHFTNREGMASGIYVIIIVLICGSVFLSSFKRGLKNIPIVQKNIKGDKYFGYTQDWQNFLKCSEWCADSLPSSALVVSRKAPMSFVYGKGKKFFPIYSVIKKDTATNQSNPDSALAFFQKNNVTHVMLPQLRLNPNNSAQGFINTIHNILAPIAQKYPTALKLIHTEGYDEVTQLYEIKYNNK
ncbi:MAG: glycosyltransferase family 39 protein [Bacteroidetes bacterium]|nr:glycosyltransferase family 39 protein [Bacteroidota bacterium]